MTSNFLKNMFSLTFGSAVAQGLAMLTPLILINLYSPASVGQYSFVVLTGSILATFFTLRSESLLISLDKNKEFEVVASLSIKASLILGLITQFFTLVLYTLDLWPFFSGFIFIPAVASGVALFQISREIQIRHEKYIGESALNSSRSILNFGGQFFLGLSYANFYGLILPKVITDFFYSVVTLTYNFPKNHESAFLRAVALKYRTVCLQLFTGRILMNVSNNLLSLYWPFFFSFQSLGLVYLSLKITQLPGNIIGENLSKIFEKFFVRGKIKRLKNTLVKTLLATFTLSALATLIIYFFLEPAISLIGNDNWANASTYSLLFSPIIFTTIVSAGLGSCFKLSNRVQTLNLFDFSEGLIKNSIVICIGFFYEKNPSSMILAYSFMTLLFCVLKSGYVLFKIPNAEFRALGVAR